MMETLNEKILDVIRDVHCDTDNWGHCGGINRESQKEAANEIEKLVLQEKISFLEWLVINNDKAGYVNIEDIESIISDLTNQLNQLK